MSDSSIYAQALNHAKGELATLSKQKQEIDQKYDHLLGIIAAISGETPAKKSGGAKGPRVLSGVFSAYREIFSQTSEPLTSKQVFDMTVSRGYAPKNVAHTQAGIHTLCKRGELEPVANSSPRQYRAKSTAPAVEAATPAEAATA